MQKFWEIVIAIISEIGKVNTIFEKYCFASEINLDIETHIDCSKINSLEFIQLNKVGIFAFFLV